MDCAYLLKFGLIMIEERKKDTASKNNYLFRTLKTVCRYSPGTITISSHRHLNSFHEIFESFTPLCLPDKQSKQNIQRTMDNER